MNTFKSIALSLIAAPFAFAAPQAQGAAYAPPLPAPIVDLYVPPTRSESPIAATSSIAYRYDDTTQSWVAIYQAPWQDASILRLAGYAKSSQSLYLMHSRGISCSRDGGETWSEAIPSGFPSDTSQAAVIAVHPANRKQAVFALSGACWTTRDNGQTFQRIHNNETVVGAAYSPSEADADAALLVATHRTLYVTGLGRSRHFDLPAGFAAVRELVADPYLPIAYLRCGDDKLILIDIENEQMVAAQIFPDSLSPTPLIAGSSSLWTANDASLVIENVASEASYDVAQLSGKPSLIRANPRQQDAVYYAVGNALHSFEGAFANLPASIIAELPAKRFSPLAAKTDANRSTDSSNTELAALVNSQPELQAVIAAAIAQNLESPETMMEWSKKVRGRHWLPELRLSGYARQTPVNASRIETVTDRYGLQRDNDLRLSDDVRSLNYVGISFNWDLENLAFDDDAFDAARERRLQSKERRALASQIADLYYERIELMARQRGLIPASPSDKLTLDSTSLYLAIRERTDLLNAIVGSPTFE